MMKSGSAFLFGVLMLTACTPANTGPQSSTTINNKTYAPLENSRRPIWVVRPEYPIPADDHHIEGFVDFEFTVAPDGSVVNPQITAEEPSGYGFARAATKVFGRFKFKPDDVNGVPAATPARYRFLFKLAR
jgi:TonB family protein